MLFALVRIFPFLVLLAFPLIPPVEGVIPPVTVWQHDSRVPGGCGAAVVIAGAVPRPWPDADGEEVLLVNRSPRPIRLEGWMLRAGRRQRALPAVELPAGVRLHLDAESLGQLRLRNADGQLWLIDPCGAVRDVIRWEEPDTGHWLLRATTSPAGSETQPRLLTGTRQAPGGSSTTPSLLSQQPVPLGSH